MNLKKTIKTAALKKYAFDKLQLTHNSSDNKSLWAIVWLSFFGGMASVMVFSILSLFMTEELHLSYKEIGYIEGIAIALAFMMKIVCGIASDFFKKRKVIIVLGTFLSVLIKPMFALATGMFGIFAAKSLDRLAKGIRSAPTEALIADLSTVSQEGISYGVRYTFYALGFMSGGLASSLLMHATHNNFRFVFWCSLAPALLSFLILIFFVKEPDFTKIQTKPLQWTLTDIKQLPNSFWQLMSVSFFLMLARFSDSFLHYRGREVGIQIAAIPFLMMMYNCVEAIVPLPIGKLADKVNRNVLLILGISILVLGNVILLFFDGYYAVVCAIILAGLHMGMTQGLLGSCIASLTAPHLRGTGFAIFYLIVGIAATLGNFIAGHLAEYSQALGYGVLGAFAWGAVTSALSALYLCVLYRQTK